LEALLNFGAEAKQTQLTAANYYADKANNFDKIDGRNPGYTKRKVLTSNLSNYTENYMLTSVFKIVLF